MGELRACWNSCSYPQCLPEGTDKEFGDKMKLFQQHWRDLATCHDAEQVQYCGIIVVHCLHQGNQREGIFPRRWRQLEGEGGGGVLGLIY